MLTINIRLFSSLTSLHPSVELKHFLLQDPSAGHSYVELLIFWTHPHTGPINGKSHSSCIKFWPLVHDFIKCTQTFTNKNKSNHYVIIEF